MQKIQTQKRYELENRLKFLENEWIRMDNLNKIFKKFSKDSKYINKIDLNLSAEDRELVVNCTKKRLFEDALFFENQREAKELRAKIESPKEDSQPYEIVEENDRIKIYFPCPISGRMLGIIRCCGFRIDIGDPRKPWTRPLNSKGKFMTQLVIKKIEFMMKGGKMDETPEPVECSGE